MTQEQIQQIYKWWSLFQNGGEKLCEIRCLKKGKNMPTYSGYYHNVENIIRDVSYMSDNTDYQIYFVLNSANHACYDRNQKEVLQKNPAETTTDADIVQRDWIIIDLDPIRPSGVGSTNEQFEAAHVMAIKVYKFLMSQGCSEPIVCESGNGYHILIPVFLENSKENKNLIEKFLKTLSTLFSNDVVDIDKEVANASRICKLYGTEARKGTNTQEHPWRLSKIVKYPEEIIATDKAYIEKIANICNDERPTPSRDNNYSNDKFDIVDFLNRHGIGYKETRISNGTRYILDECPFGGHKAPDSMVFQYDNGALSFFCFHNSCSDYTWKDFRLHYEPDAYDKKDYKEYVSKREYHAKYKEPDVKKETEADGKKWLDWDDIQDISDKDLVAIKTGFHVFDKLTKGLVLQELTVLCGLNSSGKSTILNTIALNAVQRNYTTAIFSGELRPQRLKGWIAQVAAGKNYVSKNPDSERSYDVDRKVMPYISQWLNGKLKIYSHEKYGSLTAQLTNDIEECVNTFGTKLIIIDNLMALSLDGEGDKNDKQKSFVLKLVDIAKRCNVHIILVVHPRKEIGMQFLRKESVKGDGAITDAADNVLLIHKVGDDFDKRATDFLGKDRVAQLLEYNNVIEIAKNRDYGISDMFVGLYFEQESRRFKNSMAEYVHYDWEELAMQTSIERMQPNKMFDDANKELSY